MAIKLAKKPEAPPPLFVAALRACVGRDPGFLRAERLATAGPFAWLPSDGWSALDDLLDAAAREGVAA
jgi:hypothetical protein